MISPSNSIIIIRVSGPFSGHSDINLRLGDALTQIGRRLSHRSGMMAKAEDMWQCQTVNCGYIYDPDRGDRKGKIPRGTRFEDLPDDWKCPICGATKKMFRQLGQPAA